MTRFARFASWFLKMNVRTTAQAQEIHSILNEGKTNAITNSTELEWNKLARIIQRRNDMGLLSSMNLREKSKIDTAVICLMAFIKIKRKDIPNSRKTLNIGLLDSLSIDAYVNEKKINEQMRNTGVGSSVNQATTAFTR